MDEEELNRRLSKAVETGYLHLAYSDITDSQLRSLAGLTSLTTLDLSNCWKLTDEGLAHLAALTSLTKLDLSGCRNLTDEGLAHLAGLTSLTTLSLNECKNLTNEGLAHLTGLTSLTTLDLSEYGRLTDEGLAHLAGLTSLSMLDLLNCRTLTDEGLARIAVLTSLTTLDLGGCEMTGEGLAHLVALTSLTTLNLSGCGRLTDECLAHLTGLASLKTLALRGRGTLTDKGFAHLARLTSLTTLDLSGRGKLTDKGLASLAGLSALTTLDLSYCGKLTDEGLAHLVGLTSLTTLKLIGCGSLTDECLAHLAGLTALTTLELSGFGNLSDRGLAHLAGLTALTTLALRGRGNLTGKGLAHLAGLPALTTLDLCGSGELTDEGLAHLAELSSLTTLDLSYCGKLTDEGLAALARLTALTTLDLNGCKLVRVGQEVIRTRTPSTIFAALRSGRQVARIRVALVGMGRVGKSLLFEPLFMNNPLPEEKLSSVETHDVSIVRPEQVEWRPVWRHGSTELVTRPYVWDFGGQIVLHGVHEEFLRPDGRTVYVLILAANRPLQRALDHHGQEGGNGLDYWLRTIGMFAGDAPVVVAITQCDRYRADALRTVDAPLFEQIRLFDSDDPKLLAYLQHAANVVAVVDGCSARERLDAPGKPFDGVLRLRRSIEEAMGELPELAKRFPQSTVGLIERVEREWRTAGTASKSQFAAWCDDVERNSGDGIDPDTQLEILRSLGVVFFFGVTKAEQRRWEEGYDEGSALPHGQLIRRRSVEATGAFASTIINPGWFKWPMYQVLRGTEEKWRFNRDELEAVLRAGVELARQQVPDLAPPDDALHILEHAMRFTGLCYEHFDERSRQALWCFPRGRRDRGVPPDWFTSHGDDAAQTTFSWPILREAAFHRFGIEHLGRQRVALGPDGVPQLWRHELRLSPSRRGVGAFAAAEFDASTIRVVVHGGDMRGREDLLDELEEHLAECAGRTGMRREDGQLSSDGVPESTGDDVPTSGIRSGVVLKGAELRQRVLNELMDWHGCTQENWVVTKTTQPLEGKEISKRIGLARAGEMSPVWQQWFRGITETTKKQTLYRNICNSGAEKLATWLRRIWKEEFGSDSEGQRGTTGNNMDRFEE
jgi:GTPase SAR1 family protein